VLGEKDTQRRITMKYTSCVTPSNLLLPVFCVSRGYTKSIYFYGLLMLLLYVVTFATPISIIFITTAYIMMARAGAYAHAKARKENEVATGRQVAVRYFSRKSTVRRYCTGSCYR
jgi:hypothetical protein